jgi:hypothetical protein
VTYDHRDASAFTREDCYAAIGRQATMTLTGRVVDAGESTSGPFVRFEVDEHLGFGPVALVVDLDLLTLCVKEN